MEENEIYSNSGDLQLEELQYQTTILTNINKNLETMNQNFDLYFPLLAVPIFVLTIFKLFLRW